MYGLYNDLQNQCEVVVSMHSLLQTRYQAFCGLCTVHYQLSKQMIGLEWLEGLTSFKCSTRCIFMNMHVAYSRIGKQEHSVSTGTRQCEDRKFLIHLQSHCMYKLLENSMERDRLNTFDDLVTWCLLLIHSPDWEMDGWTPTYKQHICFSYFCPPCRDN